MTFNISAATAYIASQSIAGLLKIFDLDDLPDEIMERDCPCLWPNVNSGVWDGGEVQRVTFGSGGLSSTEARRDLTYTLRYRMCYQPVGAGRFAVKSHLPGMATITGNILAKFISDTFDVMVGSIEIHPTSWSSPQSMVTDPSGKEFYGVDFTFTVKEYTELG